MASTVNDNMQDFDLDAQHFDMDAQRDLFDMAMLLDDSHVDVEDRLRTFHKRHDHRMAVIWVSVALAACLALFFIVTLTRQSQPDLNSSPIAYTEVRNLKGITIVGQKGEKIESTETVKTTEKNVFNVMDAEQSDVVLTAAIPAGSTYEMRLSDGTRVFMHSNSRLVFPSRFTGKSREVRLDGEAYFIVAHDAEHPFIVHGGKMETKVLGTEFYVRAYGNSHDNVTLIKGKVNVKSGNADATIEPGERATITDGTIKKEKADLTPYEYWRDGYLFYDHQSIKNILENIAADNGYRVEYRTSAPLDREMHFVAERTEGTQYVLRALSDLTGLNIQLSGKVIVVR